MTKRAQPAANTMPNEHATAVRAGEAHGAAVRDAAVAAANAGRDAGKRAVAACSVAKSYVTAFFGAVARR